MDAREFAGMMLDLERISRASVENLFFRSCAQYELSMNELRLLLELHKAGRSTVGEVSDVQDPAREHGGTGKAVGTARVDPPGAQPGGRTRRLFGTHRGGRGQGGGDPESGTGTICADFAKRAAGNSRGHPCRAQGVVCAACADLNGKGLTNRPESFTMKSEEYSAFCN